MSDDLKLRQIPLWPTVFHAVSNPRADEHKLELVKLCRRLEALGKQWGVAQEAKHGLFESPPTLLEEPEADGFAGFLRAAVRAAAGRRLGGIDFECWCHVTNGGGHHEVHAHARVLQGYGLCGIYCVQKAQVSPTNGTLRFYSPNVLDEPDVATITLEDGQLVMFPGHIRHAATPYSGLEDRIVIAFNAYYR